MPTDQGSQKRYPPELKERAVRLVHQTVAENGGKRFGVVSRVARQLGIGVESLRAWVAQAEIDAGARAGLATDERARLVALEKENRELFSRVLRQTESPYWLRLRQRP
jgi:transposase